MTLRFAVTCLLLLSSGVLNLLAQQTNPPLNKVCTSETEQDLLRAFSAECVKLSKLWTSLMLQPSYVLVTSGP